ncbi:hypothetical protein RWX45_12805, partial [Actinomyces sp. MRS3W]|nr:hypothetical protein [Actinomyces sp. MRS3W]
MNQDAGEELTADAQATVRLGDADEAGQGGIAIRGRYGTAMVSPAAPEQVRAQVLAALGGPAHNAPAEGTPNTRAGAEPEALEVGDAPAHPVSDEQTAPRPDGAGLLETGVWVDPDDAVPVEVDLGEDAAAAGETVVDPFPSVRAARYPEPEPGSGRRRRRAAPAPDSDTAVAAAAPA